MNTAQRTLLAYKLSDAANLAAGALFLGQFLDDRPFSTALALSGLGGWITLMAWAVVLAAGKED